MKFHRTTSLLQTIATPFPIVCQSSFKNRKIVPFISFIMKYNQYQYNQLVTSFFLPRHSKGFYIETNKLNFRYT